MAKRIVSLLPSATEVLYFLGLGDQVVGVTYECNMPPEAAALPHLTSTILPTGATPGEIDQIIGAAMSAGEQLYVLDREMLKALEPDLIVTQDLCQVCALPAGDLTRAVAELGVEAAVYTYDPMNLEGVLDSMAELAKIAEAPASGVAKLGELRKRLEQLRAENTPADQSSAPKVLLLEWPDPPYTPGHWIPDLIEAAGGHTLLGDPGGRSSATTWQAVAETGAEILIVAPCGFDQSAAQDQLEDVLKRPELENLPAVLNGKSYAIDADAFIVRPGPRLVDGVQALAELFS